MTNQIMDNQNLQALGLGFHRGPIVAWLVCANMAVFVAALRWWKYSFYLHLFFSLVVIIISLMATIPIFKVWIPSIPHYINAYPNLSSHDKIQFIHDFIGFIAILLVGIQVITGIITKYIKRSQTANPKFVIWCRRSHIICSFFIMLLAKFNYLQIIWRQVQVKIQFIALLIADITSLIIYFIIKFKYPLFQKVISNLGNIFWFKHQNNAFFSFFQKVKQIFSPPSPLSFQKLKIQKLGIQKYFTEDQIKLSNYVLFNDYVYNTDKLRKVHPGGEFIIKQTNKRQVDRFIYGSSPLQILPETIIHKHTKDSFDICGQPVAKIQRTSPLNGMNQLSKIKSFYKKKIAQKSSTYTIYLNIDSSSDDKQLASDRKGAISQQLLKYQGFTHSSQFGQYFTLSMTDKKNNVTCTKLYTTIWSMRPSNIEFIENNFSLSLSKQISKNPYDMNPNSCDNMQYNKKSSQSQIIPLVIKRYQKGQFTSELFNDNFDGNLIISRPMGGGMNYEKIKPNGKVIIVSAGTGILPFGDFIDIMFKRIKYIEKSNISNIIAENDPLVTQDLIKQRQFYLYHAAQFVQDILSIYLYQISQLCKSSLISFKACLRISKDPENIPTVYNSTNLRVCKQYFNSLIKKEHLTDKTQLNKIYICGSAIVNYQIGKLMQEEKINEDQYHFM